MRLWGSTPPLSLKVIMINEAYIKYYMKLAKVVGENKTSCYTRKIGVVIVDPKANRILGTGKNGPPKGTPHTDDDEYLENVVWPQLTVDEKRFALANFNLVYEEEDDKELKQMFSSSACNGKTCPRRLVGAISGKRLELCSCAHAEQNAIINSAQSVAGGWMFAWCSTPCIDCTKAIINSGIERLYCLDVGEQDYSTGARWLLYKAKIPIFQLLPEWYEA